MRIAIHIINLRFMYVIIIIMDIKKTNITGYTVILPSNRKVRLIAQPDQNCWEITDTSHGAIGHVTLTTTELQDLLEAYLNISRQERDSGFLN